MIDISDVTVMDLLPDVLRSDDEVKAFSYAVSTLSKRLIDMAEKCKIYSAIDSLNDDVLDVLAIELHTQHYDQLYTTDVKRSLIKGTLAWYMHAGTKWTVEDVARDIFGPSSYVQENQDSAGNALDPFTFNLVVSGSVSSTDISKAEKAVELAKNVRSHVGTVIEQAGAQLDQYIGGAMVRGDVQMSNRLEV